MDTRVTAADGHAERIAALAMLELRADRAVTVASDSWAVSGRTLGAAWRVASRTAAVPTVTASHRLPSDEQRHL